VYSFPSKYKEGLTEKEISEIINLISLSETNSETTFDDVIIALGNKGGILGFSDDSSEILYSRYALEKMLIDLTDIPHDGE
jgi:hypothetical protein